MAYMLTGRKTGAVMFTPDTGTIQSEQLAMSSKVTSYPVEDGSDINDHVIKDPVKLSLSGVLIGGEGAKSALESMREQRDLLTYCGNIRLDTMAITSLSFDTKSQNKDGYAFKLACQQVILTAAEYVPTGAIPMSAQSKGTNSQTKPEGNAGLTYTQTAHAPLGSVGGGSYGPTPDRGSDGYPGL